jgi:hypothetical protein
MSKQTQVWTKIPSRSFRRHRVRWSPTNERRVIGMRQRGIGDRLIEGLQQFHIMGQRWRRQDGIIRRERQLRVRGVIQTLHLVRSVVQEQIRIMGRFFAFAAARCSLPDVFGGFGWGSPFSIFRPWIDSGKRARAVCVIIVVAGLRGRWSSLIFAGRRRNSGRLATRYSTSLGGWRNV